MFDTESEIQQLIQIEARKLNCHLMRNNSGAFKDSTGRMVLFGLGHTSSVNNQHIKSSDLIGWTVVDGRAVFTAVEVKRPGWTFSDKDKRAVAQKAFIDWVKKHGGLAGFATSVEDFRKIIGR